MSHWYLNLRPLLFLSLKSQCLNIYFVTMIPLNFYKIKCFSIYSYIVYAIICRLIILIFFVYHYVRLPCTTVAFTILLSGNLLWCSPKKLIFCATFSGFTSKYLSTMANNANYGHQQYVMIYHVIKFCTLLKEWYIIKEVLHFAHFYDVYVQNDPNTRIDRPKEILRCMNF